MTQSGPRTSHDRRRLESYRAGFDMPAAPSERPRLQAAAIQLLSSTPALTEAARRVLAEWPESCNHYLGGEPTAARAEWLCRAACFITASVPDGLTRSVWHSWLPPAQQDTARETALAVIREWKTREDDDGAETLPLF